MELKNFKIEEFDSKTLPGTGGRMRVSTLLKIDKARDLYGEPIIIRHAIRLDTDEKRIMANHPGAVKNSSHKHGWAVDCAPANIELGDEWEDWRKFLDALWSAGFRRFGIMRNTVHVDDDPARKAVAIWNYVTTRPVIYDRCLTWFKGKL